MAYCGIVEAWWGFTLVILVCLPPMAESYHLRKATGKNGASTSSYKEGKILFGNFFEKRRTGLPISVHADGVMASSATDSIGYQADYAGRHELFVLVHFMHVYVICMQAYIASMCMNLIPVSLLCVQDNCYILVYNGSA